MTVDIEQLSGELEILATFSDAPAPAVTQLTAEPAVQLGLF